MEAVFKPQEPSQVRPVLIGHSPEIERIRQVAAKLGRGGPPILLLGETGTGKEVVARHIHSVSPSGPFVPIDCALLGTLLESELFGHTKGAFTGAIANKTGLIELAEGGTAFFDEIGELPLDVQAKLLRLLQEKEIRPLGGLARRKTNFRLIAATNRELAREVERGTFRLDLYYRLNVVTVRIAPLREHKEDIPDLANHFLARYGRNHELTPELLDIFLAYDWPGNVRELENCIQRMTAINSGPYVTAADLPTALGNASAQRKPPGRAYPLAMAQAANAGGSRSGGLRLDAREREAIREALEITKGDRSRAAEMLGIGRTTLYRRLKQYHF
ncbi:MAG: sigma-54 dependent transcriptional regulator [Bryobacteraceae bacterium]